MKSEYSTLEGGTEQDQSLAKQACGADGRLAVEGSVETLPIQTNIDCVRRVKWNRKSGRLV